MTSSEPSLVEVLSLAANQVDGGQIKAAEEKLKSWETQPGFYSALMDIVINHSLDTSIRWQAVLYVKNGIDRYWRKMAPNAIGEDEKVAIRSKLLQTFSEPVQQIALQNAVLIGKAARFDVPRDWSELIPSLLSAVQSDSNLIQHRALQVLHHVIKSLASKRLASDRRVFHDMVEQLMPYLLSIWQSHHASMTEQAASGSNEVMISLEKATLAFKVLRKSIVLGLRKPHENKEAISLMGSIFDQTQFTLNIRCQLPSYTDAFEKYLVLHLKFLFDLLNLHPFSFVPILRRSLTFVCTLCFSDEGEKLLFRNSRG